MRSAFFEATARYGRVDAWVYDTVIAPAVDELTRELARPFLDAVPPSGTLLDVGCGGGQLAVHLAGLREDISIVGLDLSSSQVARARKRAASFGARVRFVEGSALAMPFDDASFDVIVSVASIKHWPDQERGFAECVRVLRPRGMLLVGEVDRGCRFADASEFVAKWRLPSVLSRLTLPGFRTFVAGQGVDLDDARALGAAHREALEDVMVSRVAGTPALQLVARKR